MKRNNPKHQLSDAALVAGYLAGDDHAFEELFVRYRPELLGYFFHHFSDWDKAEDLTEEVFRRVLEEFRKGAYREEGKFRGWIFEHVHNVMKEELRRLSHHPEHMNAEQDEADDHSVAPADDAPTPEEKMMTRQQYSLLKKGKKHLTKRQHRNLQLRYAEGKSHAEIAKIMHTTEAGSRSLCRKAINSLRMWMKRNGEA